LKACASGLTEEQYAQEFECSFEAAVIGAYYGKLMARPSDKRITGVPYEPTAQVYTAWDLGIRDSTAIWFAQVVGREIHLIDYYEASGVDLGTTSGNRNRPISTRATSFHTTRKLKSWERAKAAWKFWKALG
jgi:hypothetical protein